MLQLLLLRHAKSDWSHAGPPDHDRPLNPRGRRDALRVGRRLRELGLVPEAALVSTARRTTETARLVLAANGVSASDGPDDGPPAGTLRTRRLYGASAAGILEIVRRKGGRASPLLVVGHNPGMTELAAWFRGRWRPFPTAALLAVSVEARRWAELGPTTGTKVESFTRPGDLPRRTGNTSGR